MPGKTIVPMGWPFAASVKVNYGPGFGVYRVGPLEPFNMISGVSKSGALLPAATTGSTSRCRWARRSSRRSAAR